MDCCGFCDISIWAILIVSSFVLLYLYGSYPGTIWKKLGVPSPPSKSFYGHMHLLYDKNVGRKVCMEKWTQQFGNIFGILYFRDPVLVVTDLEALKEILVKDFNNYVERYLVADDFLWQPMVRKGVFFNFGQDWKRIRRIMTPSFSSGKLRLLTRYINTTAGQLIDKFTQHTESGSNPEAKVIFSAYSLDALVGPAFGLELDSQNNVEGPFYQNARGLITLRPSLQYVMTAIGLFPVLGHLFKMLGIYFLPESHVQFFEKQLTKLVLERKGNPDQLEHHDFLQFLINAEADSSEDLVGSKKLTTEEIVAQGIVFVIAGYETTSTTLQWLAYELARNQEVQEKMKKEIESVVGDDGDVNYEHCQKLKYMEAVINETLRMYPPIMNITRRAQESKRVKGFTIPANASILIPVHHIGRDPALFENPDTFNPDRFTDDLNKPLSSIDFLSFGFGPRHCMGLRLAVIQVKIALVHMLRAFSFEDTLPKTVDINYASGLSSPKEPIKLIIKRCKV